MGLFLVCSTNFHTLTAKHCELGSCVVAATTGCFHLIKNSVTVDLLFSCGGTSGSISVTLSICEYIFVYIRSRSNETITLSYFTVTRSLR